MPPIGTDFKLSTLEGVLVWDKYFLDTQAVFPPELPCETESQETLKCNKGKVVLKFRLGNSLCGCKGPFKHAAAQPLCSLGRRLQDGSRSPRISLRTHLSLGAARRSLSHSIHPQVWMVIHKVFAKPLYNKKLYWCLKS